MKEKPSRRRWVYSCNCVALAQQMICSDTCYQIGYQLEVASETDLTFFAPVGCVLFWPPSAPLHDIINCALWPAPSRSLVIRLSNEAYYRWLTPFLRDNSFLAYEY